MIVEVEMVAFKEEGKDFGIRMVEVPDREAARKSLDKLLELVYLYGQNDLREISADWVPPVTYPPTLEQRVPSVSVGDVIRIEGRRFLVGALGFKELGSKEGGWKIGYGITGC